MLSQASRIAASLLVVLGLGAQASSMQVVMIDYTPPDGYHGPREVGWAANSRETPPTSDGGFHGVRYPSGPTGSITLVPQREAEHIETKSAHNTPMRESLVLALLGVGALIIVRRRAN